MVCPRRGAQCAPKVRLKRRRGSCPCITGRVSPPAGGGTVSLRATGAHTRRSGRPASNRRIAAALSESEATFLSVRGGHTDNTHQRTKGPPSRRPLRKRIASMRQRFFPGRALRAPTGWQHLPRISKGSKLLPALERAGERHLVHKFQMPADRDAVRQAGDLDPKRLQQP